MNKFLKMMDNARAAFKECDAIAFEEDVFNEFYRESLNALDKAGRNGIIIGAVTVGTAWYVSSLIKKHMRTEQIKDSEVED